MKKRLFSTLLALCLVLTLLPATALADAATEPDIKITNAEDLRSFFAGFPGSGYAYQGQTIRLDADIDLNNTELAVGGGVFKGTFDGNGHTLKNFTMSAPLFGNNIGTGAVVKNLTVKSATLENTASGLPRLGIICRNLNGTMESVTVEDCTIHSATEMLGVVGGLAAMTQNDSVAKNCTVKNLTVNAEAGARSVGGAFGLLTGNENTTVENVTVDGLTVQGTAKCTVNGQQTGMSIGAVFGIDSIGAEESDKISGNTGTTPVLTGLTYMAKIGDSYFRTLKSAVNAATDGDTVTVLKDIEVSMSNTQAYTSGSAVARTWITVWDKDITLDLNGHTISLADDAKNADHSQYPQWFRLFVLASGAKLTVTGNGTIDGTCADDIVNYTYIFNLHTNSNSTLTIESGSYYANTVVHVYGSNTVAINGGTFGLPENVMENAGTKLSGYLTHLLNAQSYWPGLITVYGGTLIGADPRSMDDGNMVADGCCVKESSTRASDGVTLYTVAKHVLQDATCTDPKTCANCGETEGEALGHDFSNNAYYCRRGCGEKNPDYRPETATPTLSAPPSQNPFADVSLANYFCSAVLWAVDEGIATGKDETHFAPYDPCTRGQLVTFLWRAAGEPMAKNRSIPFSDVKESGTFREAILWAAENEIITGYSDGTFRPNKAVTRQQVATILWRYAELRDMDVSVGEDTNILSFNDAFEVSEYAVSAIQWAVGAGVMQGDNGNLLPQGTCTRAQIVTFLYRLLAK